MSLQIRRGTAAQLGNITPVVGELIYTTDTRAVFVGDGTTAGGIAIAVGGSGNVSGTNLFTNGQVSAGGNITGGQVTATGNITANYFIGNGSALTGLTASSNANSLTGTVLAANVVTSSLTSLGTLTSLSVSGTVTSGNLTAAGTVSAAGNISGGNISATNYISVTISAIGNITGGNIGTGGQLTATGNIVTSRFFVGNGSQLTGIAASSVDASGLTGNTLSATVLYSSLTTVGTLTSLSVSNNIQGGNLKTAGLISASGTVTGGNILTGGNISATANVTGGNVSTGGLVSATGNVTGGNVSTGGLVSATGNVTGGNVSTGGLVSATGNVTGGNLRATTDINAGGNVTATSHTGTSVSVTANITGGNIVTSGQISATGTITGGNLSVTNIAGTLTTASQTNITSIGTLGALAVTANVTGGNILTGGSISAGGNITGAYILGNGSQLTGLAASYGNANVVANLVALGSNPVSSTGNVTGGNLRATTDINAGGNINGSNLSVGTGIVSVGSVINNNANGVGNIGSSGTYFNTVFAKATSAQYADLAECYLGDAYYVPGTVVSFGGPNEITFCDSDQDPAVAGVVSTTPAYSMNTGLTGEHVVSVALMGRVPCEVQGPVTKGALMVAAGNGRARAQLNPAAGTIIGKALESFDGDVGTIEIVVGRV